MYRKRAMNFRCGSRIDPAHLSRALQDDLEQRSLDAGDGRDGLSMRHGVASPSMPLDAYGRPSLIDYECWEEATVKLRSQGRSIEVSL